MKRSMIFIMLVFITCITIAQEDDSGFMDYSDISLEELMQTETVTAAKKAQVAAEAPAIISILSAEQIEKLGISSLYEALNYIPGILVTESYFGYSMVNIRGVLQTHYNNKVLMMVNGHPMREVMNGSFHLEMVPLEAVKRIEVIRGPGSALYGTNAFAGVINIITKEGRDMNGTALKAGGGSFSTYEISASTGRGDEKSDYYVAASVTGGDGYPFNVEKDERGQSATLDYENDFGNLFASFKTGSWTFNAAYFQQQKMKFGLTPVLDYSGISDYEGWFFDIKMEKELNESLGLTTRLRYDQMDREADVGHFPYDGFMGHEDADTETVAGGHMLGLEVQLDYNPSERFSLLGGVVYEDSGTDPYLFKFKDDGTTHPFSAYVGSYDATDLSLYSQAMINASDRASFVVGFRFNDNSDSGTAFAPRAGFVYALGKSTYLKLLYGEAFRSPDFFEKHVSTMNVLFGNTDLESEKVQNLDLALDITLKNRMNFRVNLFYLSTDDLITRVPTDDPDTTGASAAIYVNAGGENIWGVESGILSPLGKSATFFLNYSFKDGENKDTDEDLIYLAEHTATAGLSWKVASWLFFNPDIQYVSTRGKADPERNIEEVDAYTLVNLTLNFPINDRFKFSITGRNLLDEDYTYPEYVRRNLSDIPGGAERAVYARIGWKF